MKFSLFAIATVLAMSAVGCSPKSSGPSPSAPSAAQPDGNSKPATPSSKLTVHLIDKDQDENPIAPDSDKGITAVSCFNPTTLERDFLSERLRRGSSSLAVGLHISMGAKKYEIVTKEVSYGGGPTVMVRQVDGDGQLEKLVCDDTLKEI